MDKSKTHVVVTRFDREEVALLDMVARGCGRSRNAVLRLAAREFVERALMPELARSVSAAVQKAM